MGVVTSGVLNAELASTRPKLERLGKLERPKRQGSSRRPIRLSPRFAGCAGRCPGVSRAFGARGVGCCARSSRGLSWCCGVILKGRFSVTDQLELKAWRFLAAHRVGTLAVSFLEFIDDAPHRRIRAPSSSDVGCSEVGVGQNFGAAAIALAFELGMPCQNDAGEQVTGSLTLQSGDADSSSSASIAAHHSGETPKNSRRTRSRKTGSTTGATSAEAPTEGGSARLDDLSGSNP